MALTILNNELLIWRDLLVYTTIISGNFSITEINVVYLNLLCLITAGWIAYDKDSAFDLRLTRQQKQQCRWNRFLVSIGIFAVIYFMITPSTYYWAKELKMKITDFPVTWLLNVISTITYFSATRALIWFLQAVGYRNGFFDEFEPMPSDTRRPTPDSTAYIGTNSFTSSDSK